MMNAYYINALSDSLITFILYLMIMIAVLAAYQLIPERLKRLFLPGRLPVEDGTEQHEVLAPPSRSRAA